MKELLKKHKKALNIIVAILGFALITAIYFTPVFQGKRVKQHDIEMYKGMSKEIVDFKERTGEQTLWTNSMFGGMPAWNISVSQDSNLLNPINKILTFGFPHPIGAVFISMLGFFILLLVLDVGVWISFLGAIAFGLTSYLYIIIGAGHNSKAMSIAYMAPVIAGIILTYKGKYLWGCILTAISLALEVRAGHLQITYYLLFIVIIIAIAEFIDDLKNKKLLHFAKASGLLIVAAIIGILTCSTTLYTNYEYGKETMRGKPVLTKDDANQTKGLDRDYITQWSYGIGETWSLMIPNAKGGASSYIGEKNPALDKADPRFKSTIAQQNAYWGDQPGTSGPVYVGAIIVFLFVLGAFIVKGKLKWVLLIATLLSILLSWGKNFMGFTNFFLDFIPGYDKFRAVSMTLVIAEFTMPLLAFLGLSEFIKHPERIKQNMKYIYISFGLTGGLCLLFYIMPTLFFNFLSQNEAEQFKSLVAGKDGALYQSLSTQLENVRIAIFRKDAMRSFLFIALASIMLYAYAKGKLKATPLFIAMAAFILIDMLLIDKRYLNNDNFISKRQYDKPFTMTAADQFILQDKTLDFRVINLTKDIFNDASTSYFHKSIGGYHGAKLRRYQDVISQYLSPEIVNFNSIFKNARSNQDVIDGLEQQKVLNMLNTKYIIYSPDSEPLLNPKAFGNAWIVNDIDWAGTPNDEFDAIASTNLRNTAIVNNEFKEQIGTYVPNDSIEATINLISYKPNKLVYNFNGEEDKLVVFSEIWTKNGWKLYIDGEERPLIRANYLLRAAKVPSGEHEIVMKFAPAIWHIGNTISFISSLILVIGLIVAITLTIRAKKGSTKA
jgi:Bacterial membrane protein YfhO.